MKILMNHPGHKNYHICFNSLVFILALLLRNISPGFPQVVPSLQRIYFISDVQAPMKVEKIISKPYRNEEARDSLFADLIHQHPKNLFMLGDLTSKGSKEKAWAPLDTFLNSLYQMHTSVYAIPGNHEYMGKSAGMRMFKSRFPDQWLNGYLISIDSIAIVMLNSNFKDLSKNELSKQLTWYKTVMDFLDSDPGIKAIIVCTHHAPYSNSKVVGSSKQVADLVVPRFEKSQKSKLFISGHSHNLEYFSDSTGKHFLVIGGGGGIAQPLIPLDERIYHDLLDQDVKPLYFYLLIEKNGNCLKLTARGFKKDFSFFELDFGILTMN
jgi:predicted MPP superfamily phosphohydrolase